MRSSEAPPAEHGSDTMHATATHLANRALGLAARVRWLLGARPRVRRGLGLGLRAYGQKGQGEIIGRLDNLDAFFSRCFDGKQR